MNAILNNPLAPFFIGYERLLDTSELPSTKNYPPYNLSKVGENTYILELAVAGFSESELDIKLTKDQKKTLTIHGETTNVEADHEYLHKGIAARSFTKKFTLAELIEVKKVSLNNGILTIRLEALKDSSKFEETINIT